MKLLLERFDNHIPNLDSSTADIEIYEILTRDCFNLDLPLEFPLEFFSKIFSFVDEVLSHHQLPQGRAADLMRIASCLGQAKLDVSLPNYQLYVSHVTDLPTFQLTPNPKTDSKFKEFLWAIEGAAILKLIQSQAAYSLTNDEEINELFQQFPAFSELLDHEKDREEVAKLSKYLSVMKHAVSVVPAKGNQSHLLNLVARLSEGKYATYITGTGNSKMTRRRLDIYFLIGGVVPIKKTKVLGPERSISNSSSSSIDSDVGFETLSEIPSLSSTSLQVMNPFVIDPVFSDAYNDQGYAIDEGIFCIMKQDVCPEMLHGASPQTQQLMQRLKEQLKRYIFRKRHKGTNENNHEFIDNKLNYEVLSALTCIAAPVFTPDQRVEELRRLMKNLIGIKRMSVNSDKCLIIEASLILLLDCREEYRYIKITMDRFIEDFPSFESKTGTERLSLLRYRNIMAVALLLYGNKANKKRNHLLKLVTSIVEGRRVKRVTGGGATGATKCRLDIYSTLTGITRVPKKSPGKSLYGSLKPGSGTEGGCAVISNVNGTSHDDDAFSFLDEDGNADNEDDDDDDDDHFVPRGYSGVSGCSEIMDRDFDTYFTDQISTATAAHGSFSSSVNKFGQLRSDNAGNISPDPKDSSDSYYDNYDDLLIAVIESKDDLEGDVSTVGAA